MRMAGCSSGCPPKTYYVVLLAVAVMNHNLFPSARLQGMEKDGTSVELEILFRVEIRENDGIKRSGKMVSFFRDSQCLLFRSMLD